MDILTTPVSSRSTPVSISSSAGANQVVSFNDVFTGYVDGARPKQTDRGSAEPVMLVGEITSKTRTVSELLMQHRELRSSTWDIIHSEQNQKKEYTTILPGTRIYYNTEDGNLTWSTTIHHSSPPEQAPVSTYSDPPLPGLSDQNIRQGSRPVTEMQLGALSENVPTVSHLLKNHPQLRDHTWNLLSSSVNRDKDFHRIAKGTEIYLNTKNMEITWNVADTRAQVPRNATSAVPEALHLNSGASKHPGPAADLSEAVQRYLGTSYEEINCYELLVKGLRHMDIPYTGRDGLYTKLTRMALDKGMPPNAYLNGEGIVKAAGSLVLFKNYADIANWRDEAASLIREIEPLLDSGQILSFSTEKRGHTGIVSKQDSQWTFINSGRLDNSVDVNSVHKGVGEEILHEEISNWFKLAHAKGETLSVTLGRLERDKIRTAFTMSESFSKRI